MRLLLCLFLCFPAYECIAQPPFDKGGYADIFSLTAQKTSEIIKLDGELNEKTWFKAIPSENFWQHFPVDKDRAGKKTEVRLSYDDLFLYIAAICFDSTASTTPYTIQTLKRDQKFFDSDGFSVIIDPQRQTSNGFIFGVSPYNVQSEGLMAANAPINFDWDNRWFSNTKRYPDRWVVEMAIPFKTLRYESDKRTWSINFVRNDTKSNQFHTWAWVPVNFRSVDLGYTGSLNFADSLPDSKKNISLIPYATGSLRQNNLTDKNVYGEANGGFDAKLAISSSLNLDLTVNPDFSQVEVDRQVTNLTRFNIFFPERRTFFLENDDLFSGYIYPEIRPFYSRSIGLDNDGNTIPIVAGARLSGNIDKKTRLGIMNIQTAKRDNFAAQNYTAASVQRNYFKRSFTKAYFLNRHAFLTDEQKKANPLEAYGRNTGFESLFINEKGSLNAWVGYHLSWKQNLKNDNSIKNTGFQYTGRNFDAVFDVNLVGTNYHADLGFIQRIQNYDAEKDSIIRLGFNQYYNELNYNIYPKKGVINRHVVGLESIMVYNPGGGLNERFNRLRYFGFFKNTSSIKVRTDNVDVRLLFPTRFTEKVPLPPAKYLYSQYNVEYGSDARKKIVYSASVRVGKYYGGDFQRYMASLTYRAQPWGNFSLNVESNVLKFDEPYGNAELFLISPRFEINFSNSLFWTTFVQYNTQRNNFNINSRLQWRFKPMSDIYLVYTDNYFVDPFLKNKNKAIVFKANYWLNL